MICTVTQLEKQYLGTASRWNSVTRGRKAFVRRCAFDTGSKKILEDTRWHDNYKLYCALYATHLLLQASAFVSKKSDLIHQVNSTFEIDVHPSIAFTCLTVECLIQHFHFWNQIVDLNIDGQGCFRSNMSTLPLVDGASRSRDTRRLLCGSICFDQSLQLTLQTQDIHNGARCKKNK